MSVGRHALHRVSQEFPVGPLLPEPHLPATCHRFLCLVLRIPAPSLLGLEVGSPRQRNASSDRSHTPPQGPLVGPAAACTRTRTPWGPTSLGAPSTKTPPNAPPPTSSSATPGQACVGRRPKCRIVVPNRLRFPGPSEKRSRTPSTPPPPQTSLPVAHQPRPLRPSPSRPS